MLPFSFCRYFAAICLFSLSLFFCIEAQAYTIIEKRVIVAPPARCACARHYPCCARIVWIHQYWTCMAFTEDGFCDTWRLRPGSWGKVRLR